MSEKQLKFTLESDRQSIGISDEGYALSGFEVCNLLNSLYQQCEALQDENDKLRQMIKENVFERYEKGSLADLEFKAIAYDDIVRVEMPNGLEPRVIVYCKQGKKENVMSFCQMFIPFGIAYEIKEVVDDE